MSIETLPDGWTRVKFGDVVRNSNENSRDLKADGIDRVIGLDHLDPGSLRLLRWDHLADLPDGTTFTRKFKPGQVLFGKRRAYQRKVAVPDFEGVCSGDILIFEPADKRVLAEFLPYVVQSDGFFDHALGTSAGSLSPRTKWVELARYEFALPPLDEQQRISQSLTALDSSLEAVINNCVKSQSLAMVARRAALNDVFARSMDSGWRHLTLGEVARWSSGGTPKAGVSEFYGGSIPWAVIGDLTNGDVWETRSSLTASGLASSSAKLVPTGAVLVAMYGSIGKLGIVRIPLSTNQAIASAIVDPQLVRPEYLFWWLRHIEPLLIGQGKGGVQRNISQEVLKRMPIAVPPLREQDGIISYLSEAWTSFSAVTALLEEKVGLLSSIRTSAREFFLSGRGVACET